ncbi:MAG TPA: autotransporter-associated beta strand repeat-containing protein, partial [Chthoniobacter sp.]|nr:autotransporter-associated beta strand repeat-containing protein [Chthoniobacter sp.]
MNGSPGGLLEFSSLASAGNANIINQGGTVTGAAGGYTVFDGAAKGGSATITTNGGSNGGGGGGTLFRDSTDGGTARAITNGNGVFDISQLTSGGMKIGSIEGSGSYYLGANSLTVGGNNLSTTVSGVIADNGVTDGTGGSLIKTGTGTLTLTAANTYTGGTTVGAGVVQLGTAGTAGTLDGTGTISVNSGGVLRIVNAGAAIYGVTIANDITNGVPNAGLGTVDIHSANLNLLAGTLTNGSAGLLALTQNGSGTTIVTNANNLYSGATTITGGILQIGTAPTGPNL